MRTVKTELMPLILSYATVCSYGLYAGCLYIRTVAGINVHTWNKYGKLLYIDYPAESQEITVKLTTITAIRTARKRSSPASSTTMKIIYVYGISLMLRQMITCPLTGIRLIRQG